MMLRVSAKIPPHQLRRMEHRLSSIRRGVPRATTSAIIRTSRTIDSRITRAVAKELGVTVRAMRKSRGLKRPVWTTLVRRGRDVTGATTSVTARRLSLKHFAPKQTRLGVSVKRSRRRESIRSAFIVDELGSHVFKRRSRARLPIDRLETEPVSKIAAASPDVQIVMRDAPTILARNLASQVSRLVNRRGRGGPSIASIDREIGRNLGDG